MNHLIERLERATGPDHAIDCSIRAALGYRDTHIGLAYTASIDAALTLVPEGWGARVSNRGTAEAWSPGGGPLSAEIHIPAAHTVPAIALCIAALKALEWSR